MRVAILLPVAADACVFEDAMAMGRILRAKGYGAQLYADITVHSWLQGDALGMEQLPRLAGEDVLIYYVCPGQQPPVELAALECRKLLVFYGIEPPRYWKDYDPARRDACEAGMQQLCALAGQVDGCITAADYHAQVLGELNYQCPIYVRPPLLSFSEYNKAPDSALMERYGSDGVTNFLCVGRLAPHRKQEDVIRAFACYQQYCKPDARLFLVGDDGATRYVQRLRRYAQALELTEDQVVFTGTVSFSALLAYYHLASIFLSMSEYEGFGVPLVEAMYFGVPILARDTTSVADLLDGCGILLPTSDPVEAALAADRVRQDPALRREIAAGQRRRYQALSFPVVRSTLEDQFAQFLAAVPPKKKRRRLWFAAKR